MGCGSGEQAGGWRSSDGDRLTGAGLEIQEQSYSPELVSFGYDLALLKR
jgi:hypothetical protein